MRRVYFISMMAVALMLGMTGCSKEDGVVNNGGMSRLDSTSMQLIISALTAPSTYAGDPNAIPAEVALHSVKVLIYEQTASGFTLERIVGPLTMADFDKVAGSDAYRLKNTSKITTTTGAKKIYVSMNYSGAFPEVGTSIGNVSTLVSTLTEMNSLSNTTGGFAMFSTAPTNAVLVAEDHADYLTSNKANVTVKRLVAKISVEEGPSLRSGGKILSADGELTNLQFALNNVNKTSYVLQNLVGVTPGITVQDNNWSSYKASDFFTISSFALASAEYRAVDTVGATISGGTIHPVYVPENTVQAYDPEGKNLTFVSVRAQFAPKFFCNETGLSKGLNASAPKSFWTVVLAGGFLYYFDVESEATAFQSAHAGSVKSEKYTDGLCYWRGYLNQTGAADASIVGSKAAKFDILRNVYYKVIINRIKALGFPSDQGKVTESTTLMIDVNVIPWGTYADNWEL